MRISIQRVNSSIFRDWISILSESAHCLVNIYAVTAAGYCFNHTIPQRPVGSWVETMVSLYYFEVLGSNLVADSHFLLRGSFILFSVHVACRLFTRGCLLFLRPFVRVVGYRFRSWFSATRKMARRVRKHPRLAMKLWFQDWATHRRYANS